MKTRTLLALICFSFVVPSFSGQSNIHPARTNAATTLDPILLTITHTITSSLLPKTSAQPFCVDDEKDCSKVEDCEKRCQCYYDRCAGACSDTDVKCVNKCIRDWQSCKDDCAQAALRNHSTETTNPKATLASISEEARKHFVMGTTLFKDAKTPSDFSQAGSEFKQAVDVAPQWPDARYNLALARESAGDYSGAIAEFKLYQQFKLSDAEARTIQGRIYVLEAKAEAAARKQADEQKAAAAEEQKRRDYQDKIGFLAGTWNMVRVVKCHCPINGQTIHSQQIITIVGRNVLIADADGEYKEFPNLRGTISGQDYSSINWVVPGDHGLPDFPINVTVNKSAPNYQIKWKSPGTSETDSGRSWTWSMEADFQLTK